MSAIINGDSPSVTFSDGTTQSTAFKAGAVTQSYLATGVAGTGPAFRATNSSNQSITTNVNTKVSFQTEVFDTASCFNNTGSTVGSIPAYAFLPNVAGYYYVSLTLSHNWSGAGSAISTYIYKNGSIDTASTIKFVSSVGPWGGQNANSIIYLNGTTDYIEAYALSNNTGSTIDTSGANGSTIFTASLLRTA